MRTLFLFTELVAIATDNTTRTVELQQCGQQFMVFDILSLFAKGTDDYTTV